MNLSNHQLMHLWPGDAPGALGSAPEDTPAVQAFLPPEGQATGAAMIVCPGGGYWVLAEHEGVPVAEWLASHGIAAFVLRYRLVPRYHYPVQLWDGQRAIQFVRAHAAEWHLDPARIGILGFSAGGHLASQTATHFASAPGDPSASDPIERVSARPDVHVLVYPVIAFDDHAAFLGKAPSEELIKQVNSEKQVTAETPPAFLVHSIDDPLPVAGTDAYAASLDAAGVPYEYVRGALGGHGFGLQESWTTPCLSWLQQNGFVSGGSYVGGR